MKSVTQISSLYVLGKQKKLFLFIVGEMCLLFRNNFFVRPFDAIFTAAQECPLFEVPGKNEFLCNNYIG